MKRILIVEDEFIIALLLEKLIQQMGHEVTAKVGSAEAAIAKVKQVALDLVLMDISLPGDLDGIEAVNHIRKFSDIPVIYMSGDSLETTRRRAMKTRPAGYLTKPFKTETIKELIRKATAENRNN